MAGPVPAIHVLFVARKTWMPATSAGMTAQLSGGAKLFPDAGIIHAINE